MKAIDTTQLAHVVLQQMNQDLAKKLSADVVFVKSQMRFPLDDQFRIVIETIKQSHKKQKKTQDNLCVVIETTGGYIETVERMVMVMRRHYKHVTFVIPNHAYSAGTVLVLSGDKIYMDYYSVLGPIDPQVPNDNNDSFLPGAGYLSKFQELALYVNKERSINPSGAQAELAYLIKRFDPAKLFYIEQAIEHGESLIAKWLVEHKFKDWKVTSSGRRVTLKMKRDRASSIAKILGDATKWHSHGRGISLQELESDDIKLVVDNFGDDEELSTMIRNYHGLATDHAAKHKVNNFIHSSVAGLRSL